jgi:hypothetical protein
VEFEKFCKENPRTATRTGAKKALTELKRLRKAVEKMAFQNDNSCRHDWFRRLKSGDWKWLREKDEYFG